MSFGENDVTLPSGWLLQLSGNIWGGNLTTLEGIFYNFKLLGEEHYYFSSSQPPEIVPDKESQNSNKSHNSTSEQLTLSVA